MNINRHNYEEFFLLLVDNELTAADQKAVELFLRLNPDLQQELILLQQSKLPADPIVFNIKNELLHNFEFASLQEKLLLFADNELSKNERQSIEEMIYFDQATATEWNILKQTQLQPDQEIIFPNKHSLYRPKVLTLLGFSWWRIAAAAIFLGIGLWTGIEVIKNNAGEMPGDNNLVKTVKDQQTRNSFNERAYLLREKPLSNAPVVSESPKKGDNIHSMVQTTAPNAKTSENIVGRDLLNQKNKSLAIDNSKIRNGLTESLKSQLELNIKPQDNTNSIANIQSPGPEIINKALTIDIPEKRPEKTGEPEKNGIVINTNEPKNTYARNAVYTGDENEKNASGTIYLDDEKVKHSKISGLFRKLKRVIERNSNIKTGNGINIAGIEIATK